MLQLDIAKEKWSCEHDQIDCIRKISLIGENNREIDIENTKYHFE